MEFPRSPDSLSTAWTCTTYRDSTNPSSPSALPDDTGNECRSAASGAGTLRRFAALLKRVTGATRQASVVNEKDEKALGQAESGRSPDICSGDSAVVPAQQEIVVRSLRDFPSGYPNLATFKDSDEGFTLFRRFGYLQTRVLLGKQDELRCLEEQLDGLDREEMCSEPDNLFTRECQGDTRQGLLSSIETKFCEYSRLLIAAQQLRSFNRPSESEHRSVLNYFHNVGPIDEQESKYIYCKEDLLSLRAGRENAWLDRALAKLLGMAYLTPLRCPIDWIFVTKESKKKASEKSQIYFSKERIENCSSATITLTVVFMLIVPIYLLYHLVQEDGGVLSRSANATYIGILLVATLLFAAIMSFFTSAKRHEILGAAAAYCAVLVVFLGNLGNAKHGQG